MNLHQPPDFLLPLIRFCKPLKCGLPIPPPPLSAKSLLLQFPAPRFPPPPSISLSPHFVPRTEKKSTRDLTAHDRKGKEFPEILETPFFCCSREADFYPTGSMVAPSNKKKQAVHVFVQQEGIFLSKYDLLREASPFGGSEAIFLALLTLLHKSPSPLPLPPPHICGTNQHLLSHMQRREEPLMSTYSRGGRGEETNNKGNKF